MWLYRNMRLSNLDLLLPLVCAYKHLESHSSKTPWGSQYFVPLGYFLWFMTKVSVRSIIKREKKVKENKPTNQKKPNPSKTHVHPPRKDWVINYAQFSMSLDELLHFLPRNSWLLNRILLSWHTFFICLQTMRRHRNEVTIELRKVSLILFISRVTFLTFLWCLN